MHRHSTSSRSLPCGNAFLGAEEAFEAASTLATTLVAQSIHPTLVPWEMASFAHVSKCPTDSQPGRHWLSRLDAQTWPHGAASCWGNDTIETERLRVIGAERPFWTICVLAWAGGQEQSASHFVAAPVPADTIFRCTTACSRTSGRSEAWCQRTNPGCG